MKNSRPIRSQTSDGVWQNQSRLKSQKHNFAGRSGNCDGSEDPARRPLRFKFMEENKSEKAEGRHPQSEVRQYKQTEFRFTFGPFLHGQGAETWDVRRMIEAAEVYEDAAHQLRVISSIVAKYQKGQVECQKGAVLHPSSPAESLKMPPARKLALN